MVGCCLAKRKGTSEEEIRIENGTLGSCYRPCGRGNRLLSTTTRTGILLLRRHQGGRPDGDHDRACTDPDARRRGPFGRHVTPLARDLWVIFSAQRVADVGHPVPAWPAQPAGAEVGRADGDRAVWGE